MSNTTEQNINTIIRAGGHEIDTKDLPIVSLVALAQRGFSHVASNEVASKVTAKIDGALREQLGEGWDEAEGVERKNAFAAFREANAGTILDWTTEAVANAVKAIIDGTIGAPRERSLSIDPLERAMQVIAREQVITVLKSKGIKVPKGDEVVKFASGDKTMTQMVASRLANPKFRPEIEKAAKKVLAERDRLAKASKAADGVNEEDLGL